MRLFDCNMSFGRPMIKPLRYSETASDLLKEMDYYGIDEAIVYHARQKDDSPDVGNRILLDEIRGFDRLHGTLAILPPQTGEITIENLIEPLRNENVCAFRAFPSEHRYLMSRVSLKPLYDLMVERNIPLFISADESCCGISRWRLIEMILSEAPDLTLIVTDHGCWGEDRFFRPLIEKYENLYLDISKYHMDGGISDFCKKYGAERLLFGTGYPHLNPGGTILMLMHADITSREREMIASRNLERILRRIKV